MPAYLKIRRFSLNMANSYHQIDWDILERELAARVVRCEVPDCNDQAFWMIPTGVPGFLCASHEDKFKSSRAAGIGIETAIRKSWQLTMEIIQNAAYEDADKILIAVVEPHVPSAVPPVPRVEPPVPPVPRVEPPVPAQPQQSQQLILGLLHL